MADISPLTNYRKSMGMSLQEIADLLDVHKTTVLRWEAGKIPAERVLELEKITGIPRRRLRADLFNAA
jgi:excisionase family DNA binding protein